MTKKGRTAKPRSGGGITSNKLVHPKMRGGKRTLDAVSPSAVSDLGMAVGYKRVPLVKSTPKDFVPLGNDLATNVGRGGPGTGREIFPRGYQSCHGTPAKGEPGMQGKADRGERAILGPQPNDTSPFHRVPFRRGQQTNE
jgi:hypothetical protein